MGVEAAFWSARRVLVTGNTGFKGSWLTLWLRRLGADVTGLADAVPTEPSLYRLAALGDDVPQHWVDVRDADGVAAAVRAVRPEIVIHMAAQPMVRRSFASPLQTYAVNVMGSAHVLDAVRTCDDTRVVVNVTTDKCYENREWEWGYREDEPMGGHDPYSSSKGCAELVTAAYRSSFLAERGVRVASARAGNVIGGGDWGEDRLVPDIMRGALAGQAIPIRRPDAVRPWQHVLNPLHGYLTLAQAAWDDPAHATAYNFGPDDADAQPVAAVVERLSERWDGPLAIVTDEGPHPHEATYLKLDSSRAKARLGWRPTWDLARGLDATAQWYLALRDGAPAADTTDAQIRRFAEDAA